MSAQRVSIGGSRDLISTLPDEVLCKILSLLPTKLASSTSVLSKRWRNLLALVDSLDFNDAIGDPRGFSDFVGKTLAALLTNSSIVKRFSLNCQHQHDKTQVENWISTVLKRGFLELHLESACMHFTETDYLTSNTLVKLTLPLSDGYMPHGVVFLPKLKTLSLVLVGLVGSEMHEHLISGCPVLEELFIHYADPSARTRVWFSPSTIVASPSIKRLTISYHFPGGREVPNTVWFKTPSLVYLDYSSYVTDQYHVDFGSLVEAKLDLRFYGERVLDLDGYRINDTGEEDDTEDDSDSDSGCGCEEDDDCGFGENDDLKGEDDSDLDAEDDVYDNDSGSDSDSDSEEEDDSDSDSEDEDDSDVEAEDVLCDVTDLVAGISNVKTLHLSPDSLEVLHYVCKPIPVFHNLLTLSFESDKEKGWQVLPLLLNNSPNLETLVIKGLVHKVTDSCGNACVCIAKKLKMTMEEEVCCLSSCQVKVLNISRYGGTLRELKQMRHFLGNLKCLETVKVCVEVDRREDINVNKYYTSITDALTKLPRVSSKCQIHFHFV